MKLSFFHRLFFISLFMTSCPSIFTESMKNDTEIESQLTAEVFEGVMASCHKHTQEIGWAAQQIIQTLCHNKEQYQIENKAKVIETLKQIQGLTQKIELEILSKNTHEALVQAIIFNNGLIHFLSVGLTSKFTNFDIIEFLEKIQKRSLTNIGDETIVTVVIKNEENLKNLLHEIGKTGLTWYNLVHRSMKEYNIYDLAKKGAILGAGLCVLAYAYCATNKNPDGKTFLSDWTNKFDFISRFADTYIGGAPVKCKFTNENNNAVTEGFMYRVLGSKDSAVPQTIFQSLVSKGMALQESGIANIAPLFAVSLSGMAQYCLGDGYTWAKDTYMEKMNKIDQYLSGSQPNKNINSDGQEKVYFEDLIGCQELESLANDLASFVEHPEYYERSKTETHRGILLYGPPQTGKSNFAKALRTRVQDRLEKAGISKKIGFVDGKFLLDRKCSIEDIFEYAAYTAPCILFFDEIDLIGTNREKDPVQTGKLLTCMQGIDMTSKQIIVIGATNRIEQLDKALLVDGRFGKKYFIDYPEYKYRKQFITKELEKRAITISQDFIDRIAQETDGCNCSYNNLRRIITEAINISVREHRLVTEDDFEKALDIEIRKIHFGSRNKTSDEEKQIIAAYQAGKTLMRHLLSSNREIVKITIEDVERPIKSKKTGYALSIGDEDNSDNDKLASEKQETKLKLGEVFTISKNNKKDLISDQEIKKECLILLAGNVAQEVLLGQSFSQCNKHDRADAMQIIYQEFAHGEKIDDKIRAQAITVKTTDEKEIFNILSNNKKFLATISNTLVQDTTINYEQWNSLIKSYTPAG